MIIKSSLFDFEQFPDGLARERGIEAQSYVPVNLTEVYDIYKIKFRSGEQTEFSPDKRTFKN